MQCRTKTMSPNHMLINSGVPYFHFFFFLYRAWRCETSTQVNGNTAFWLMKLLEVTSPVGFWVWTNMKKSHCWWILGCLTSLVHMHWLWNTNVTTEASSRELIFNGKYWRTVTGQLESCRWEWWCAGFLQSCLEAFPSFTVVWNDFPDIRHPYNKNITILCINQSAH